MPAAHQDKGGQVDSWSASYAVPRDELFAWHERQGALERLTPPWEPVDVVLSGAGLQAGSKRILELRFGPLRKRWVAEHVACEQGHSFCDVQREGPFASWEHTHLMESEGEARSSLLDRVAWRLPFGAVGKLAIPFVRRRLDAMFAYRHARLSRDLARHAPHLGVRPMKVLVTGSSGLVGSALSSFLSTGGHEVVRLVRRASSGPGEIAWDPEAGTIDAAALEGFDAIVHLAGENIAGQRWNPEQKERISRSRVQGTQLLASALAGLKRPPEVFVSASAVGYYGNRGHEPVDEASTPGRGFLADVCRAWEDATKPASEAGIRTVNLRFGVILTPAGGALAKMLTPFKLGVGGKLGNGRQGMSWISLGDAVGAIHHAIVTKELAGAVNAVAPERTTNGSFTSTLGRVLRRPTVLPMPAFAARLAFGEMADELLLTGQHVEPSRLAQTGYTFEDPELEGALRHLLGKERTRSSPSAAKA